MNEESAFLSAILAAPDDDTARLAFADWLDAHGDPERAGFIRLQCKHAQTWGEALSITGDADCERMEELEEEHGKSWLSHLPRLTGIE